MKGKLLQIFCSLILLGITHYPSFVQAQSTSPEVWAGAGTHFTGTNAQVSWTLGETVTQTLGGPSQTLTQGFHQTKLTITAVADPIQDWNIEVFPNPAYDQVNIRFSGSSQAHSISLIDGLGKVVKVIPENLSLEHSLDVSQLSQGSYYLQIKNSSLGKAQSFKIQIIHTN